MLNSPKKERYNKFENCESKVQRYSLVKVGDQQKILVKDR